MDHSDITAGRVSTFEQQSNRSITYALSRCWPWLLLSAVLVVLYFPVLRGLSSQWWEDSNYSYGFLVPVFSTYVIWERREKLRQLAWKPAWFGFAVMLGSLALFFLGRLGAELFLTRISLVGIIAGLLLFLRGWPLVEALLFPLGVLLLMIPLPAIIYNQIVFPLQLLASRLAAASMNSFHILPVLREGNVLVLPSSRLEVAEACSGIRSLMSMLAVSVFYGYFAEERTWIRVLVCLATVPIAVFSNAARVVFAAVASEHWGDRMLEGTPHLLSGVVLFLVSVAAMIAFHVLVSVPARTFSRHEARS